MTLLPNTHLDLGCGDTPRNPYRRTHIYGLDIREIDNRDGISFKRADLNFEKIPFADNFLDQYQLLII